MSYYGFTVTDKGRALIAKLVAGEKLSLSRIVVGSGTCPDSTKPRELTDLITPIALATSTTPTYEGDSVSMIVEYRSDLNGGLDKGFWLSEFGVFAYDPDEGDVMIYYACLGDYPQWVSAMSDTGVDVRRFPITIVIGDDAGIEVDYNCEAWVTLDDVQKYFTSTLLPDFLEEAQKLIDKHNADPDAHSSIQNQMSVIDSRVSLLELIISTEVDGNPFAVTFETLNDVTVEGVWNSGAYRIDF